MRFQEENANLLGVMGIQDKDEVTLIRHAYVHPLHQHRGIGGQLLHYLVSMTDKPILIGTRSSAHWAIDFYRKHEFRVLKETEKAHCLKKYWNIPDRQIETSVVLADKKWK